MKETIFDKTKTFWYLRLYLKQIFENMNEMVSRVYEMNLDAFWKITCRGKWKSKKSFDNSYHKCIGKCLEVIFLWLPVVMFKKLRPGISKNKIIGSSFLS